MRMSTSAADEMRQSLIEKKSAALEGLAAELHRQGITASSTVLSGL
jgi:hypothetical protein